MEPLYEYDFEIKYVENKKNKVTDALSSRPFMNALSVVRFNLMENIKAEIEQDPFYVAILEKIAMHLFDKVE